MDLTTPEPASWLVPTFGSGLTRKSQDSEGSLFDGPPDLHQFSLTKG